VRVNIEPASQINSMAFKRFRLRKSVAFHSRVVSRFVAQPVRKGIGGRAMLFLGGV
jgi:hypothetical protein